MPKRKLLQSDKGFTLVEIIAVLIILGILAVLAVSRYVDLEQKARKNVFSTVLNEINAREFLTWSDQKISGSGYVSDAKIFGEMNYDVDPNWEWNPGDPTISGGTLNFKGESLTLSRTVSTKDQPPIWKLAP
jgi:prepilin-type N-terminal cleavage/methylation domain-containing protein